MTIASEMPILSELSKVMRGRARDVARAWDVDLLDVDYSTLQNNVISYFYIDCHVALNIHLFIFG